MSGGCQCNRSILYPHRRDSCLSVPPTAPVQCVPPFVAGWNFLTISTRCQVILCESMTTRTFSSPDTKPALTRGAIWARRLIALLFGIILTLLMTEGLLSLDPVGLRYIRDYIKLTDAIIPAPAGYTYAPGVYQLSRSTVTMQEDGTRFMPDTKPNGAQTLVFVGDSVTFGLGVNADETFVNLIARQLPDTHVINAGIPAFNIQNIRRMVAAQPADARIVYLITDNDADPEFLPSFAPRDRFPDMPWVALYIRFLPVVLQATDPRFGNAGTDLEMYRREAELLSTDPRVLIVGYDDALTPMTPGAIAIQTFTSRLSFADEHPDAKGHQQLADQILPLLSTLLG